MRFLAVLESAIDHTMQLGKPSGTATKYKFGYVHALTAPSHAGLRFGVSKALHALTSCTCSGTEPRNNNFSYA